MIGRHCAARRSRKSLEVATSGPGRGLMNTMFLLGADFLTLIRSQPRGIVISGLFGFVHEGRRVMGVHESGNPLIYLL